MVASSESRSTRNAFLSPSAAPVSTRPRAARPEKSAARRMRNGASSSARAGRGSDSASRRTSIAPKENGFDIGGDLLDDWWERV